MANKRKGGSFHCHQCGLLMMMVRIPDPHVSFYRDKSRHLLTWQCPLCEHVHDQYIRIRSLLDKFNTLSPFVGPETTLELHA